MALLSARRTGLGQNDSFIDEVSEEVRRDRFFRFLSRYGWLVGLILILVVGGAAALEWRKASGRASAEAAGDALRAAYLETDPAKRAAAFEAVAASAPEAAVLASLAEAGALAEAGKKDEAAALLARLADDPATPALYRALAALQRVILLGAAMDPTERRATIESLAAENAPFRPLALEQRALLMLETGDKAAALADLESILALPGAPEQLVSRTRQLIVAAGGALPGAALVPGSGAGATSISGG